MVALAVRLAALGHPVRVCAPPDFRDWIEGLGVPFTPLGPELRSTGKADPSAAPPTPAQRRQMVADSVAAQFATVTAAAEGCDVLVAGGYLVVAAPTVAEQLGIRYVMAGYCPIFLPSPHHAPPVYPMLGQKADDTADNATLWARDTRRWNDTW
ncbi:MAG TPA: glycosyltransferase, partial [Pseudonocardiaceae bacterium]